MKLSELYWHRITPLHLLLWPLSILYRIFLLLRKCCYWLDIFPSVKLPVPIIVVDSITVEDNGKTPLILWLIEFLQARGFRPGIITRGRSNNPASPLAVTSTSDPTTIGGKILLLAKRCENNCPIWVGNDRAAVAQALLYANPTCNVIICNDGLQCPRLEREMEIVVADFNEQSFGNGMMLPAGPLRESLERLKNVDAVVTNSKRMDHIDDTDWAPTFSMKLVSETIYNVLDPGNCQLASDLKDKRLCAIASFDTSQQFFDHMQQAGLNTELHSFAEDHRFVRQDIDYPNTDAILMPEEDAIQCSEFADNKLWALPVDTWVNSELQALLLKKLSKKMTDGELDDMAYPQFK
jgi:tetraacyldisaccharide 4'-kinase